MLDEGKRVIYFLKGTGLWQYKHILVPREVKAGKIGTLKSLHYFIREKQGDFAVRFNGDVPSYLEDIAKLADKKDTVSYNLLSLPFYLAEQLHRWVDVRTSSI